MKRRNFIQSFSMGGMSLLSPLQIPVNNLADNKRNTLKFGICTDVHKDVMHDSDLRIKKFIEDAVVNEFDFIIQLGDFCRPYEYNLDFMSIWNSFPGKKYHVLGNHDMDGGFSREEVVKYWNAEGQYYSFDLHGYHFIVLDGNDHDPSPGRPSGYARFLGKEQLDWLERDLDQTTLPVFVFIHQGLDNDIDGITNSTKSRLVLERANDKAGFHKVKVVFSGHEHLDYHNVFNGIHYIQINSMSYHWLGENYQHIRYSKEVDESYPWIKYTVPYKDPIWAYIEISSNGMLRLRGRSTTFVGPSPQEIGVPKYNYGYPVVPEISDRKIKL